MKLEKWINMAYAFGAAIVIAGAWRKIIHGSFADELLTAGLVTEICLFCIMGVHELFKKPESLQSITGISGSDNAELTQSINELNSTIKKVFNR